MLHISIAFFQLCLKCFCAMASPSSSTMQGLLSCPICEESYNERDHLPKGFPCQHSLCNECLEGIIKRCDGNEVACPLCRQTVPVPKFKAAGFPNNVTILQLLVAARSQTETSPSTCKQHNTVISVFCSTCQEGICVSCMLKSPKHKGHDMEEVSDEMERCIHRSQEVLSNIIQAASAIHKNIQQKAEANNPECLLLLSKLQKSQADLGRAEGTDAEKPMKEAPAPVPDGLPAASLPQSINKDRLELLASGKVPEFDFIDLNRSNSVLLTFPRGQHAVYKISKKKFCKIAQPVLSQESVNMLEQATYAILSHDNNIVIPGDFKMMCYNKTYNFHGRPYTKVQVFHGDWSVCMYRDLDGIKCAVFALNQNGVTEKINIPDTYMKTNSSVR